jgi:hypothetical protein
MLQTKSATQPAITDVDAPESISEYELCVRWNKCPRSLLNWRKQGKVPKFYRVGKVIRYPIAGVKEFEASMKFQS